MCRLLLSMLLVASTTHAQQESLSTTLATTVHTELAYSYDKSELSKVRTTLDAEFSGELSNSSSFLIVPRLELNLSDQLTTETSRPDSYSGINGPLFENQHARGELAEAWIDLEHERMAWRLGKQHVVWGQADGIRVLDVVNPLNYREWTLPAFEDNRIATWMVNVELADIGGPGDDSTLQWLIIPDLSFSELADPGSPFFLTSPELAPQPDHNHQVVLQDAQRPSPGTLETGLRWSSFISGWDLSALYFYHFQDNPVVYRQITSAGVTVVPKYQRNQLFGFSASNAFSDWVLRLELAYNTDAYTLREDLQQQGIKQSPELASVAGLDFQGIPDWLVSYQLYQSTLTDYNNSVIRKRTSIRHTLLARKTMWNDTLTIEVKGLFNQDYDDGQVQARTDWTINDEWTVWAGLDLFFGDIEGPFGQFQTQDRIILGWETAF